MPRFRHLRLLMPFTALLALAASGLIWWAAAELVTPSRRPVQDYHREFLAGSEAHGVRVDAFTLNDGTPALMVAPSPTAPLSQRGSRVRQQLAAQGLALPPVGKTMGTLVLLHGRKGRKEDYLLIAERFCAVGFRCVIPDLPGHGEHQGSVVGFGMKESRMPAQALREAGQRFGFDPQPAGLMGISMGGSVAMHAAAEEGAPWKALVIVSSFDALQLVVHQQAISRAGPWLGGLWATSAEWLYESRTGLDLAKIKPRALAKNLTMPTLIAHGTADQIIPLQAGKRLFDALPDSLEKQWVEIPGADHDNVLITDFPIYATMARWMLRHVPTRL